MTVRWGACISDSFNVTNGVRQGGILSPQLFGTSLDDPGSKILTDKFRFSEISFYIFFRVCSLQYLAF